MKMYLRSFSRTARSLTLRHSVSTSYTNTTSFNTVKHLSHIHNGSNGKYLTTSAPFAQTHRHRHATTLTSSAHSNKSAVTHSYTISNGHQQLRNNSKHLLPLLSPTLTHDSIIHTIQARYILTIHHLNA